MDNKYLDIIGLGIFKALNDKRYPILVNGKISESAIPTSITNSITSILSLIPDAASSENKLADKNFVNSSIATNTATFRGTFDDLATLQATSADINDYAFYVHTDEIGNTAYDRYKHNGSNWVFEYTLNNSSFTAEQWSAINSGITTTKVGNYDAHLINYSNPHKVTKSQVGLGNVENVALSSWAGSNKITTLGTITTGFWNGSKIGNDYLANSSITIGTTAISLGSTAKSLAGIEKLQLNDANSNLVYDSTTGSWKLTGNLLVTGFISAGAKGNSSSGGGSSTYTQKEWLQIKEMTESASGILASAYAVKEAYNELNTAIETLAGKATNVTFAQTLTSGKQIGSISIDGKSTSLFAPANYAWSEVTGKPAFATVATSGSYTDLINKPTIASLMGSTAIGGTSSYLYWDGSAWATKSLGSNAFTSISKVSQLTNDSGYITGITKAMVEGVLTGNITSHTHSYLPLAGGTMSNTNVVTNLNADLLDGYHADSFPKNVSLGTTDLNSIDYNCLCQQTSNVNATSDRHYPIAQAGGLISILSPHSSTNQIYGAFSSNRWFARCGGSGVAYRTAWREFAFLDSNVASASKWATARTITLTGSVTGSVSIDGSANVSLATTTNHTHNYLPLSGGTLTGSLQIGASDNTAYNDMVLVRQGKYIRVNCHGTEGNIDYGTYGSGGTKTSEQSLRFSSSGLSLVSNGTVSRTILHSGNVGNYALPLSGGTLTGSVTMQGMNTNLIRNITYTSTSSWARGLINLQVDGVSKFSISALGDYTLGASDNGINYAYIGCNSYAGLNLRISATSLSWGDSPILHSGNFNSYAPKLDGTGATGTWGINISGNAGALQKYLEITDLNIPSWGIANGYSINYNTCRATVSNAPSTINNANLIMNIQNGNHSTSGQFGWQVGFFNSLNSPYVRKWTAGSVDAWYKLLHSGNYNEFAPSLTGTGASGTWGISISGNAATATNADKLDGFHESDFSRHITGTTRTTGTKYFKLGNLPKSSDSTWDAFLIQGEIGGWASLQKTVLNVCVGRRNGVAFCGYTQGLWNRNLGIDIGVNDAGEIVLIVTGQYSAWTLDLHTIQGTISYTGTTFTPTDTNFVLLSASNYVSKSLVDGTVEKATKLATSRTIWGQSFDGTGNVSGALSGVTDIAASGNVTTTGSIYGQSGVLAINSSGAVLSLNGIPGTSYSYAFYNNSDCGAGVRIVSSRSGATPIVFDSLGNVGIGTTSPSYKLDVNGQIRATSDIISGAFVTGKSTYASTYVELYGSTPFIDFHYGNSTADYTSRIIEGLSGQLTVSGKLRVGLGYTTSTDYALHIVGTAYSSAGLITDGAISAAKTSTSSDIRLKENISEIGSKTALNWLLMLKPKSWTWNDKAGVKGQSMGFVAQDVEGILPQMIRKRRDNGYLSLDYTQLHALEVAGLQDHEKRIEELERENKILKEELNKLKLNAN